MSLLLLLAACGRLDAEGSDADVGSRPTYFLALITRPSGTGAAPADYEPYALALTPVATDERVALRTSPQRGWLNGTLSPRYALDAGRHADLQAHAARLRRAGPSPQQRTARRLAGCGCDAAHFCVRGSCVTQASLVLPDGGSGADTTAITVNLVAVVPTAVAPIDVLLDAASDSPAMRLAVLDVVQRFASTWPLELNLLAQVGHTGALDHDQDGRLAVAFSAARGQVAPQIFAQTQGFFSFLDLGPAGPATATSSGNGRDLIWLRPPGSDASTTALQLIGTLAHEYTHLVQAAVRAFGGSRALSQVPEALWLEEGMAHLMEDLTGWGASNVDTVAAALAAWSTGSFASDQDSPAQRGRTYLLLRHMLDSRARAAGAHEADDAVTRLAAGRMLRDLLQEAQAGFEHQQFVDLGIDGLFAWLTALYATGNPEVRRGDAHRADYLAQSTSPLTQQRVGLAPYGTITNALGQTFSLQGPQDVTALEALAPVVRGVLPTAGSKLFTVQSIDALTPTLREARANPMGPYLRLQQIAGVDAPTN